MSEWLGITRPSQGSTCCLVLQIAFKLAPSFLIPKIGQNCFCSLEYFDIVYLFPSSNYPCSFVPPKPWQGLDNRKVIFNNRKLLQNDHNRRCRRCLSSLVSQLQQLVLTTTPRQNPSQYEDEWFWQEWIRQQATGGRLNDKCTALPQTGGLKMLYEHKMSRLLITKHSRKSA